MTDIETLFSAKDKNEVVEEGIWQTKLAAVIDGEEAHITICLDCERDDKPKWCLICERVIALPNGSSIMEARH